MLHTNYLNENPSFLIIKITVHTTTRNKKAPLNPIIKGTNNAKSDIKIYFSLAFSKKLIVPIIQEKG